MYIFRIVKSTINKKWDRRLEMALNNKKRVFCASFFVLLAMLFLIGFLIKDVVGKEKIPKIVSQIKDYKGYTRIISQEEFQFYKSFVEKQFCIKISIGTFLEVQILAPANHIRAAKGVSCKSLQQHTGHQTAYALLVPGMMLIAKTLHQRISSCFKTYAQLIKCILLAKRYPES